jgi:hypothetical protein
METVKEKPMTFKEFSAWCNERAADGCWGLNTAKICIKIIDKVQKERFWRREKAWQAINDELQIEKLIVIPINKKIKEIFG